MTSSRLIAVVWLVALFFAARAPAAQPRPASTTPAPSAKDRAVTRPKRAAPSTITPLPWAVVGLEPRWEARFFRHNEFSTPNVRSYNANGYAALALSAELYPLANATATLWRGFGVTLGYAHSIGLHSDSRRLGAEAGVQSVPVDTHFSRYNLGLRYRIAVNPQSSVPVVLGTSASWVGWDFDFGPELPRGPDLEIPTAHHQMARFGIDAGVSVLPFTFSTAVSYLHAFSVEPPSSRELAPLQYPHLVTAEGVGAELRAALGVFVWRRLELRLSAEYGVLAFHLAPIQGREDQPALVVDAYVSVGLGAHLSF